MLTHDEVSLITSASVYVSLGRLEECDLVSPGAKRNDISKRLGRPCLKTEPQNHIQLPPRSLRFIVEKILPRALRVDYMGALNERYQSVSQFVPEAVATVAAGYRIQAVAAFNKTAFVVEGG